MVLTPVRTARPMVIMAVLWEKVSVREKGEKGGRMDMPSMEWFVIYKYLVIRKHETERDGVQSLTRLETSAAGQKSRQENSMMRNFRGCDVEGRGPCMANKAIASPIPYPIPCGFLRRPEAEAAARAWSERR